MTTQEKMSFEAKSEHAAELFANCRNGKFSSANSAEHARSFEGHKQGSHWARESTIQEVLGLLRSDDAQEYCFKLWDSCKTDQIITRHEWADWLGRKLNSSALLTSSKPSESVHPEFTKGAENERT